MLIIAIITGCGTNEKKETNSTNDYKGKETALAKQFLSKGYLVNIYRSVEPLGDEFQMKFMTDDTKQMEAFLEKE